jgi:hypothetical protein
MAFKRYDGEIYKLNLLLHLNFCESVPKKKGIFYKFKLDVVKNNYERYKLSLNF